jgi:hypothetical protein
MNRNSEKPFSYILNPLINPANINWNILATNKCEDTIEYVREYFSRNGITKEIILYLYSGLYYNPPNESLVEYLLNLPEYYEWDALSQCSHDKVVNLLLDPINYNNINWDRICFNKNRKIIPLLLNNLEKINWTLLSSNISQVSIEVFKIFPEKINWNIFCHSSLNYCDTSIIDFMELNKDKITDWNYLCHSNNFYILDFISKNTDKLDVYGWRIISEKSNDNIVEQLLLNLEKIDWFYLSANNNDKIVALLFENMDKIDMSQFSSNSNNRVVNYLLKNPDNIVWGYFCFNDNKKALDFIFNNLDKVKENYIYPLSQNKNCNILEYLDRITKEKGIPLESYIDFSKDYIFEKRYNYDFLKRHISIFKEELIAYVWNPERYSKWPENPFID